MRKFHRDERTKLAEKITSEIRSKYPTDGSTCFRLLRPDEMENIYTSINPKDPSAPYSPYSHVINGNLESSFISVSSTAEGIGNFIASRAMKYFKKNPKSEFYSGCMAVIKWALLVEHDKTIMTLDLTDEECRAQVIGRHFQDRPHNGSEIFTRFANKFDERLIPWSIPFQSNSLQGPVYSIFNINVTPNPYMSGTPQDYNVKFCPYKPPQIHR